MLLKSVLSGIKIMPLCEDKYAGAEGDTTPDEDFFDRISWLAGMIRKEKTKTVASFADMDEPVDRVERSGTQREKYELTDEGRESP